MILVLASMVDSSYLAWQTGETIYVSQTTVILFTGIGLFFTFLIFGFIFLDDDIYRKKDKRAKLRMVLPLLLVSVATGFVVPYHLFLDHTARISLFLSSLVAILLFGSLVLRNIFKLVFYYLTVGLLALVCAYAVEQFTQTISIYESLLRFIKVFSLGFFLVAAIHFLYGLIEVEPYLEQRIQSSRLIALPWKRIFAALLLLGTLLQILDAVLGLRDRIIQSP